MGLFVVGSATTPLSLLTFADVKRKVAGVVSREAEDPNDVGAGDAIEEVIREFNTYRWDYLTVQANDITIVDSTGLAIGVEGYRGQYTIPAPMRDFVSAKVDFSGGDTGGTPLRWVHRGEHDKIVKVSSGQGVRFISDFQAGTTNKIELLDFPTNAGRLEIRYYRPIVVPNQNSQRMDLPREGPLESALIWKARAIVAMDKGVRGKATFYEAKGERALMKALGVDNWKFMWDTDWKPRHLLEQNYPAEEKRHEFHGTWRRER